MRMIRHVLVLLTVCVITVSSTTKHPQAASSDAAAKRTEVPSRAPTSCAAKCKDVVKPVCGTNGKTYDNYCLFSIAACKNKALALAYTAACKKPPKSSNDDDDDDGDEEEENGDYDKGNGDKNSDADVTQAPTITPALVTAVPPATATPSTMPAPATTADDASSNRRVLIQKDAPIHDNNNDDYSNCADMCTFEYDPQCGSDGITYANRCVFAAAQCRAHQTLDIVASGACRQQP